MGRAKLPRKSTNIDMTAMCDVAFLLLSFFILTTKFKPAEAIAVETPSSVASKIAPSKDFVLVTIDKDGKVFLTMDDEQKKELVANTINTERNLGNNELTYWMQVVKAAYAGEKMDLLLKGDNVSKYPAFKNVIAAFKKNELLKFQMVTNPENAPEGSELWKMSMQGIKQEN